MKKIALMLLVIIILVTASLALYGCSFESDSTVGGNVSANYKIEFMVDDEVYYTYATDGNEIITFPADPAKDGYIFDGWYIDATYYIAFSADMFENEVIDANFAVYAKFSVDENYSGDVVDPDSGTSGSGSSDSGSSSTDEYKIFFYSAGSIFHEIQTAGGELITMPSDPVLTGYTFAGWYLDDSYFTKLEVYSYLTVTMTSNSAVFAKWVATDYSITYNLNGGTNASSNPSTYTIEDSAITFANPTRVGYTFAGWSVSTIAAGSTGAVTTTASWDIVDYTITYELEGGTNDSSNASTYNVEDSTITFANPTRVGYTFTGWSVSEITTGSTGAVTTTASWKAIDYTITYNLNGGTNDSSNPSTYNVEDSTITFANPTRAGYTFAGWSVDTIAAGSTGTVATTASWDIADYAITYELEGGTNDSSNPSSYTIEDNTINFAYPTRTGYIFAGWTVAAIDAGSTGEVTTTAKWTAIDYTITYNLNGGTNDISNPSSYTIEDSTIVFANPTRVGYTFTGWSVSTITAGSTGEVTTTASWQAIEYSITYNLNGGTNDSSNPSTYTVEDNTIAFATPTKDGYIFTGWSVDTIVAGSTGEVTTTASWEYITDGTRYLSYELSSDNTAYTVVGIGSATDTDIVIPTAYNDLPVTAIGSSAFSGCCSITSVVMYDNITAIGSGAFYGCSSLQGITLPFVGAALGGTSNTHFGYIFGDSSYLYSSSSTNMPASLATVIITGGTSIGSYAFRYMSNITSITIPDSVTSIGKYAFYGCSALQSIILPFVGATLGGTSNTHFGYIFGDSSYLSSSSRSTNVPASLATVIITGGTSIGSYAFRYMSNITSITIPDSVTRIGSSAFQYCTSLETVYYNATNADYMSTIGDSSYFTSAPFSYSGSSAKGCTLIIGDNVESIGSYMFYDVDYLTKVTIGSSVTSIGDYVFSSCAKLTSVIIPVSVSVIGIGTFYWCPSLTSATIGIGVTSIGRDAFLYCDNLTIYCEATSQPNGWSSSWNSGNCTVEWACNNVTSVEPAGMYDYVLNNDSVYITAYNGTATDVVVPDTIDGYTVVSIEDAFSRKTAITSITIPDTVTSIGDDAFRGCSSLTSVVIPDTVTSIGDYAFYDCSRLTSIVIPDTATSIGDYAFYYCTSLTSIVIPDSVVSIGSYAFYNCSNLTSIVIPDLVTSIGDYAFYGCNRLTSIVIPDTVTSIGSYAFYYCTSLTSIVIPDLVTRIGYRAFEFCTSLASVTIGSSVISISSYAFQYCYMLAEVCNLSSLPIAIGSTDYGDVAYYAAVVHTDTDSLLVTDDDGFVICIYGDDVILVSYVGESTDISIPSNVTKIRCCAFYNCTKLTSVVIPDSVTNIGERIFEYCYSVTSVVFSDTSTWYLTTSSSDASSMTGGTEIDVTDSARAAINLRSGYYNYYWYKL